MPTKQERTALAFLVTLALGAAAVRVVEGQRFQQELVAAGLAPRGDSTIGARALAAQEAAVDSARRAPKRRKSGTRPSASSRPPHSPTLPAGPTLEPPVPVNVNEATAAELERLPRVGPSLARRIIEWRERHGPFAGPDDLRHVRGIGPSTVRLLDSLVTFSGRHRPIVSAGPPSPAVHTLSVR